MSVRPALLLPGSAVPAHLPSVSGAAPPAPSHRAERLHHHLGGPWMRNLLLCALACAAIGIGGASTLLAQPGPPNRFYGSLTIDGAPAPVGSSRR